MSLLLYLDIEKIPIPKEKNLTLHQGGDFIDMCKTLFDIHFGPCIEELITLSITGTPETASTFAWWHLGVPEPDEKEINIGMYEVHKWNVSTTRWRNFLDSLIINPKDFDRDTIISHQS